MLKRNFAVLLVAGMVLGGAALAWANGGAARPTLLSVAQSTSGQSTAAQKAPATAEERQARREALRTCLSGAGENAEARRQCFTTAGVRPGNGPGMRKGRDHGGPLGVLGRAVHGSVVVPGEDGGWQTVTFDRGQVDEASDASKIVLDRPDGETVTVALTADTKYHGVENAGAITDGRRATVVSRDGKALHVVQKDPARRHHPGAAPGAAPGAPGDGGNNQVPPVVPND